MATKVLFTCLPHLIKAEGAILPGAICSRILPVALNRGRTSMNTATETIPRHNTSAFSTLKSRSTKYKTLFRQKQIMVKIRAQKDSLREFIYPNDRNQEASIKPALGEREMPNVS
jgi:hypothetical protein